MATDLVPFQLGSRTVLVTKQDARDLENDLHLYGNLFVMLAKDGGHYERQAPSTISIRPEPKG